MTIARVEPALIDDMAATRPGYRYAWYVLALLVAVYTFHWVDRYLFVIAMESIKRDLGISDTALGLLSGFAFSLVYSVSGIFIARWSDLGNRRSIIAMGIGLWSAMTAVCGLAQNFLHLFIARFGVGLGESACSPPAHSLISDYFSPRQRATAIAIYGLGLYIGLATGLVVGGWVTEYYGWRRAFLFAGLPGIALALLVRYSVREPLRTASATDAADVAQQSLRAVLHFMLRRRSFVAYVLGSGLFVFAGNSVDTWAAVFLMRVHGLGSAEVGAEIGVIGGAAGVLGTLFFAVLADRLSARNVRWYLWVSLIGGMATIPVILLFLFASGPIMYVYYFLSIFFGASYMAPTFAITQRLVPARMRASSSALILFSYNIVGMAGGNLLTGVLSDALTPMYQNEAIRYALAITVMAALLAGALTFYGARNLQKDFAGLD